MFATGPRESHQTRPNKPIVTPALAAHKPHKEDAEHGGGYPGRAQDLVGNAQHIGGQPLGNMRQAAIEHALDNEDEPQRDDEIAQGATYSVAPVVSPLAGAGAAGAAAGGCSEAAGARPLALPKKRKNSESGDSSIVVPDPSRAAV